MCLKKIKVLDTKLKYHEFGYIIILTIIISHKLLLFSGVYEYIPNSNYSRSISYPYFDSAGERNVSSFVGQTTHLNCIVKDLGDKRVSNHSA